MSTARRRPKTAESERIERMVASKHFNTLPVPGKSEIRSKFAGKRQANKTAAIEAYRTVAGNVRRLRESKGLSQSDLAEAVGTGQPAISMLERGGRMPSLEVLVAIAEAFQVPVGDLFVATK